MAIDLLALGAAIGIIEQNPGSGSRVGIITNGGSFPTVRPDGQPLKNGDYVLVSNSSTFPFTIEGVTFNSSRDKGVYLEGSWGVESGVSQDTDETPVSNPSEETLSGNATMLNVANKEFVDAIKDLQQANTFKYDQVTSSKEWTVVHNMNKCPAVTVVDSAGTSIEGGVQYIDQNSLVIYFSSPFAGTAYLN